MQQIHSWEVYVANPAFYTTWRFLQEFATIQYLVPPCFYKSSPLYRILFHQVSTRIRHYTVSCSTMFLQQFATIPYLVPPCFYKNSPLYRILFHHVSTTIRHYTVSCSTMFLQQFATTPYLVPPCFYNNSPLHRILFHRVFKHHLCNRILLVCR
jgi:hypothetical protein